MIFKKAIPVNAGTFPMTGDMIRILSSLDGLKNIAEISKELGINLPALRSALTKLLESGLVEVADDQVPLVDRTFIESLRRQMVIAVGPMGDILIEDILGRMSLSLSQIPAHRASELVGHLAREIPDEENRAAFQKSMNAIIPK